MRANNLRARIKKIALAACLTATLPIWAGSARAGDPERGRLLYENHCTVCHTSVVHIREDRKATTREAMRGWIERWQKELGLQWTSVEVDDVMEFLNNRYYQLKSES